MFERYTEIAKATVVFAKGEAVQAGSSQIRPEHILLALLRDESLAGHLLQGLSAIDLQYLTQSPLSREKKLHKSGDLPLSRWSRRVFARAEEEARQLGDQRVSNAHILLGLLSVKEAKAARALINRGFSRDSIRMELNKCREENAPQTTQPITVHMTNAVLHDNETHLQRLIFEVRELTSKGQWREALRFLNESMYRSQNQSALLSQYLLPLATAVARSLSDFASVRRYCELRLSINPSDEMALYGMADCLKREGELELAQQYIDRCRNLLALKGTEVRPDVLEVLQDKLSIKCERE